MLKFVSNLKIVSLLSIVSINYSERIYRLQRATAAHLPEMLIIFVVRPFIHRYLISYRLISVANERILKLCYFNCYGYFDAHTAVCRDNICTYFVK